MPAAHRGAGGTARLVRPGGRQWRRAAIGAAGAAGRDQVAGALSQTKSATKGVAIAAAQKDALGPRCMPAAHSAAGGTPGGDGQTGSARRPAGAPGSDS